MLSCASLFLLKILILKPSSLGDVIHALPVLRLLRLHFRNSEIYWWIDERFASLLKNDPDLAGIITFERKRWGSPFNWNELIQSVVELRRHRFDLVIDLQGLARSGAFAWLANGGKLVGIEDPREGAFGFYDVRVPRPSYETHAVDWYLQVLRELHVPVHFNFNWLPQDDYAKAVIDQKWPDNGSRWMILNPGARWMNKRWPTEHFAQLARLLACDYPKHRFAVLGGSSDKEMGRAIATAVPDRAVDLTGKTSLREMIEWIRRADLMVTNDTGPMHAAAALAKPLIAVFGPTDPRRTGPYGQLENVLNISLPCLPCMKARCHYFKPIECLRALTAETVQRKAHSLVKPG